MGGKGHTLEDIIRPQIRPINQTMIGYSVRVNTMGTTAANKNRLIRQEALREQLSQQGHVQHVTDIAQKLTNLEGELDPVQVQRLKAAADIKLKLIGKYLGDVKAVEVSGADGGDLVIQVSDFKNA
jgi:hypothetical protein